jgi:hypothetical protein
MEIEVPLHTVIKFTPARGGGWTESRHPLSELHESDAFNDQITIEGLDQLGNHDPEEVSTPFWGDHMRKSSHLSMNSNSNRTG